MSRRAGPRELHIRQSQAGETPYTDGAHFLQANNFLLQSRALSTTHTSSASSQSEQCMHSCATKAAGCSSPAVVAVCCSKGGASQDYALDCQVRDAGLAKLGLACASVACCAAAEHMQSLMDESSCTARSIRAERIQISTYTVTLCGSTTLLQQAHSEAPWSPIRYCC
jgi:hypothetical protein